MSYNTGTRFLICMDTPEVHSGLTRQLQVNGVLDVQLVELPVGDFLISKDVVVEPPLRRQLKGAHASAARRPRTSSPPRNPCDLKAFRNVFFPRFKHQRLSPHHRAGRARDGASYTKTEGLPLTSLTTNR